MRMKQIITSTILWIIVVNLVSCGNSNGSNYSEQKSEAQYEELQTIAESDKGLPEESVKDVIPSFENNGLRLLAEGYKLDTIPEWNGYIRVYSDNKGGGLLSPNGEIIFSPKDYAGILGCFSYGNRFLLLTKAGSKNNSLYGIGDFQGKILVPVIYADVDFQQHLKNGYAIVKDGVSKGVYSFDKQREIVPCKHKMIKCTYDGYISTIETELTHNGSLKIMYIYRLYDYNGDEVAKPIVKDNDSQWPVMTPQ